MSVLPRFRERLVLGQVRRSLDRGEQVLGWAHARVPKVRAPAVVVVTDRRCVVHVASRNVDDRVSPWAQVRSWRPEHPGPSRVRLILDTDAGDAVAELSVDTRTRARSATRLLETLSGCADLRYADPQRSASVPQLHAERRGVRGHARRLVITLVGVAVLLLSLVFASPFVPGPGSLTAVAGIAILAREYEWARDLHVWASRQLERFLSWLARRRAALLRRPVEPASEETELVPPPVRRAA